MLILRSFADITPWHTLAKHSGQFVRHCASSCLPSSKAPGLAAIKIIRLASQCSSLQNLDIDYWQDI
jgi:hypothetical protein